jgi:hypothetical protein
MMVGLLYLAVHSKENTGSRVSAAQWTAHNNNNNNKNTTVNNMNTVGRHCTRYK